MMLYYVKLLIVELKTNNKKEKLYEPKPWAMYCNGVFVESFPSHNAAKLALHKKCEEMKRYPYDYADEYYTIKPYRYE